MISGRVVALALVTTALQGNSAQDLRVLRHSPDREGSSTSIILVTFDRPVAEELDRAPPAEGIIALDPAVERRAEWRDPVTLRFTRNSEAPARHLRHRVPDHAHRRAPVIFPPPWPPRPPGVSRPSSSISTEPSSTRSS